MSFDKPFQTKCFWAPSKSAPLVPGEITRRSCHTNDVVIEIIYSGICHSDIHSAKGEFDDVFGPATFPMVPGHEICGIVRQVGSGVKKFRVGDRAGVGCLVDSCRQCGSCQEGEENYCERRFVLTYGSPHLYDHCISCNDSGVDLTYGGYSKHIVVSERFAVKVPDNLDFSRVAPLLCAGITTFSPLRFYGLRAGHKLAVAGLGGLGHMAVKFGKAMGAEVTVLSRGNGKRDDALRKLGADHFVDTTNPEEVKAAASTFNIVLNTISSAHDVSLYVSLLKKDGKMVYVGAPPDELALRTFTLILGRRSITGSGIGGLPETQEMMDFCGEHNIVSDVELIQPEEINVAFERTLRSDVKYRFVIDVSKM